MLKSGPGRRSSKQSSSAGLGSPRQPTRRVVLFLLVFICCVLMVDGLVGDKGWFEGVRVRKEYQDLAAGITELRAENARLREQARLLREDPRTIEEIARRELGLIRPGERLFIIKDIEQKPLGPSVPEPAAPRPR